MGLIEGNKQASRRHFWSLQSRSKTVELRTDAEWIFVQFSTFVLALSFILQILDLGFSSQLMYISCRLFISTAHCRFDIKIAQFGFQLLRSLHLL